MAIDLIPHDGNIFSLLQTKKFLYLFGVLFLICALIEIWAVNRLSTFGEKISLINQEKEQLTLENQMLQDEVAKRSSLSDVEQYATALGFQDSTKIQYLSGQGLALSH